MTDNKPVCKALKQGLKLTSNIDALKKCNVYIIAVPTPVKNGKEQSANRR
jgi:UDP-N-acetyl-D-glucosamine/UDP-N-acetyl-D-galactosamine dehydrogenase